MASAVNKTPEPKFESLDIKLESFISDGGRGNEDQSSYKTFQEDSDIKVAELIKGHLGLSSELSFDMLTKENQIMIGRRLELILGIVANGALVSLIDCTLNGKDVMELASIRIERGSSIDLNDSKRNENAGSISEGKINEFKMEDGYLSPEIKHKSRQDNESPRRLNVDAITEDKINEDSSEDGAEIIERTRSLQHNGKTPIRIPGDMKNMCSVCERVFKQKCSLKIHMREQHSGEPVNHECPMCRKMFGRKSNLIQHIESVHEGRKRPCIHECPICSKKFGRKFNLNQHIEGVHEGRKWPCHLCGKDFTHRSSIDKHMKKKHNGTDVRQRRRGARRR